MAITDQITAAANKYGVDPNLALSVARAESSLDPNAVSSAGAIGVMQLMPSSFPGVNIYDPQTNIDTGVSYLAQMLQRYNGNTTLALAAYNAGPGNVDRFGGVPPFAETQNYISKVLSWFQLGTAGPIDSTIGVSDISSGDSMGSVGEMVAVVGIGLVIGMLVNG
jgi:soluble lytic murein transglycosylase-like protein